MFFIDFCRQSQAFLFLDDFIYLDDEPKIIELKEKTYLIYSVHSTAVSFLVVQAHTQYQSISLSTRDGQETNTNSDTAILKTISYPWPYTTNVAYLQSRVDYVLRPPNSTNVKTLVAVVSSVGKGTSSTDVVVIGLV